MEPPKAPLLFGKFANTLCGDGDPIVLPDGVGHVDAEAELAVVIGRTASRVSKDDALEFVARLDVRERRQRARLPVRRRPVVPRQERSTRSARSARGSCPRDELDPADLRIQQRLNGETLQDSRTSLLIFDIPTLVSYVTHAITLEPGDLILTGTPEGVGVFREPKITLAARRRRRDRDRGDRRAAERGSRRVSCRARRAVRVVPWRGRTLWTNRHTSRRTSVTDT